MHLYSLITTLLTILTLGFASAQEDSLTIPKMDSFSFEGTFQSVTLPEPISFELPPCPYTIEAAENDIAKDSMSIVIHGGFTGFGDINENLSEWFQKKYQVTFVYLGCIRSWDINTENTEGYNATIFNYLEHKYGSVVRADFDRIRTNN